MRRPVPDLARVFCVILRVCEFFVDGDRFAGRELDDGGEAEVR
jgi:hypothetical protein